MSKRKFLGYRLKDIHGVDLPYVGTSHCQHGWQWVKRPPRPVDGVTLLRFCVGVSEYHSRCAVHLSWHPRDLRIVRVYGRKASK